MFFYVDPVPAPCVFRAGPILFHFEGHAPDLFQFADHTSCETLPDRQCHPAEVVELLRQHPGLSLTTRITSFIARYENSTSTTVSTVRSTISAARIASAADSL